VREPGKKRIKLAKLLTAAGYSCDPYDLRAQTGWYRTSSRLDNDSFRWEGVGFRGLIEHHLYSYYTMTELIKTGVVVEHEDEDPPLWFKVYPKEKS
jgi:hypothetical protein